MDQNTTIQPPQRQRPRRKAASGRVALVLVTLIALLIAAVAFNATDRPVEPPAEAAAQVPGTRADVTNWFRKRDKALVKLNDDLVPLVQKKVKKPGADSAECKALDKAIKALDKLGPAPDAEVDALARAGEDKLGLAATACLAGDLATTQRLVAEAMAERAAASLPLEEALEGE